MEFEEMKLDSKILESIKEMGFTKPTEIQEGCIPLILNKRDVVGHSQTGSGKTAAFGLPIIQMIKPRLPMQALVLTPTRELAVQVKEELEEMGKHSGIKVVVVHGGVGFKYQSEFSRKAEIIVATPGRLLDHMERKSIFAREIEFVVLDEADRMLDMGFEKDVERILRGVRKDRQTIMFSATMPIAAQRMIKKYMRNPAYVEAEKHIHVDLLKQSVYRVNREQKFSLLTHLLKNTKGNALVFCRTKRETDKVAKNLRKQGLEVRPVHGDLSQQKRQRAVNEFKDGKIDVLVATDVAARGLHVSGISHVYNYDVPDNAEDYTHRIGRTARAGEKGEAVTILCSRDEDLFRGIIRSGMKVKEKELPDFEKVILVKDRFNPPRAEKRRQGKNPFNNKQKNRSRNREDDSDKPNKFRKRKPGFKGTRQKDSDKFKKKRFGKRRGQKRN